MKKSQIAAQCYTLRDYLHTSTSCDRCFAKVREIGYEAVQISGTQLDPKEIKKYADKNGLTICATHDSPDLILGNPDALIEKLNLYNCKHTAYPCPPEWSDIQEWDGLPCKHPTMQFGYPCKLGCILQS